MTQSVDPAHNLAKEVMSQEGSTLPQNQAVLGDSNPPAYSTAKANIQMTPPAQQ